MICLSLLIAIPASAISGLAGPSFASPRYYPSADKSAPYSLAVRAGDLLFISGQLGLGPDGKPLEGFGEQARAAMAGVAGAVSAGGSSMDQVVKCTIMLADIRNRTSFNAIYLEYFSRDHLPARTAFAVANLGPGVELEIDCIASVGGKKSRNLRAP